MIEKKSNSTMDLETEIIPTKMKHKTERRRSSIFSLLQKKLKRQASEPGYFEPKKLNRKYSVDSAILSDYGKTNGVYKEFLLETCSDGVSVCNGELAGAASDSDSEASRGMNPPREDVSARKQDVIARIESCYVEDPDRDTGAQGELVEEVAEENKSLLWFLLKQVRPGMDLSKVVLPTFILEPRSFLDKLSDNYYHADILSQAQHQEDPYLRFKSVLRWYLSGLYRKPKGLKKPYNPVLGETFRCCWRHRDTDSRTYYLAEQVSHHPPVSAFYVSNRKEGYVIEGSLLARSKFYGNSTSAILEGCARVHLLPWGETYVTTAPYAHCKGIVIGTLSMELGGKVHVVCPDTGYHADVEFKLRSFLGGSDQTNAISGRIKKGKDTIATIEGYWDGKIDIKDKRTGEESNLLDVAILKEQRMTRYLMKIDSQHEYESQRLWIKVSEAIANDDQVAATEQKTIIEEAQRSRARNLQLLGNRGSSIKSFTCSHQTVLLTKDGDIIT
ncbi:hypothetical protein ABMA28_017305 [Loxostege sticticalis]|uniref:Oxysterol-binding protein n=1 Tax=Loxostege sticticalis TaxID=481309 RepID=A0ABD0S1V6_LOXSC